MVSRNKKLCGPPKNPSAFFSIFDWIGICCSTCFGKILRFRKPHTVRPPSFLPANPNPKLDLTMGNLLLPSSIIPNQANSIAHPYSSNSIINHDVFGIVDRHPNVDGDDSVDDDDDDDGDGMFHGHFYLGTKVLREVEMRSPVEESLPVATLIRTPRRSNNSSPASSTTQLRHGPRGEHAIDAECRHESSVSFAVVSPQSSASISVEESDVFNNTRNIQDDPIATVSEYNLEVEPLKIREKLLDAVGSSDSASPVMVSKSNRSLLKEKLDATLSPPDAKCFTATNDKKSVGILPECKKKGASFDGRKIVDVIAINGKDTAFCSYEGKNQTQTPVGSLPDCSKSKLLFEERQNKDDRGRRSRSLTDQDFIELKGCIDLGFVFNQDHISDLCETLPALEVCYAVAHGAISPACNSEDSKSMSPGSPPISPWKVASPGDQPQRVKARLRHWAQAVACNVRQAC